MKKKCQELGPMKKKLGCGFLAFSTALSNTKGVLKKEGAKKRCFSKGSTAHAIVGDKHRSGI